jgi:homoserine O-acetyltransferase/O-succinyltransferase
MNQTASLAEPCCPPQPLTEPCRRHFVSGGLWHHLEWAPGRRKRIMIPYRMEGPEKAPVVAALGGISADRRLDQWWPEQYGRGAALDIDRFRVLSIDWLGRCWPDGSAVTTAQQAAAVLAVMDHLGIERLEACIGASYGAMVGLALAANYPDRIDRLVAISGAHCAHPMATARRLIQRQIIQLGLAAGDERRGLGLARALALTTYRPAQLFGARFDHARPDQVLGRLNSYFECQGRRLIGRFDAERYLCLSESLDRHRIDPASIRCPVELVAVSSDELVPVDQLHALDRALPNSRLRVIASDFGHDAFLKETTFIQALIRSALAAGGSQ